MTTTDSNLGIYIYKVLASLAETKDQKNGMAGDGLKSMNNLIDAFDGMIIANVNRLMARSGKKTVSVREVTFAVRLTLGNTDLCSSTVEFAQAAVDRYTKTVTSRREKAASSSKSKKLPPMSRSKMAGINFPVTRIENIMMERVTSERKSGTAAVFFSAASEHVATHLLRLAGAVAEANKKVRITTRHLKLAYSTDPDLSSLYRNVVMSGGVVPTDAPEAEVAKKPARKSKAKKSGKGKAKGAKTEKSGKTKSNKSEKAKPNPKGEKATKSKPKTKGKPAPAKGKKSK